MRADGLTVQFSQPFFSRRRQWIRGGPDPTLGRRDPDLFGHLGSGRWDPDLLDDDPDLEKEPDPNEDPDLFWILSLDSTTYLYKLSKLYNFLIF